MRRPIALLRGRLHAARSEAGFALIEVMVSAALLAVVGIGIYNGIDGPTAISGKDRLRSVAAGVAQRENERIHSLSFDELQQNQITPQTYTLQGIPFTATSTTKWVSDGSGEESCTNNSTTVDYLALTTTVTWPGMGSTPISMRSLEAPPTGTGTNLRGNLVVQIIDEKVPPQPVPNLQVSLTGAASRTATTNSEGCAIFPYIPVGNYHGTFTQTGWVDPSNAAVGTLDTTVTGNSTTAVQKQYGQASAINVQFEDSSGANATWSSGSVLTTGMSAPMTIASTPANSLVNVVNTGYTLFPATSGYTAWAGDCPDPTKTYPSATNATVSVTPGNASTVRVKLPTLTVTAKSGTTTVIPNANVYITPVASCSDPGPAPLTTKPNSPLKTDATGTRKIPLPYGDYNVCVDNGSTTSPRHRSTSAVQNRVPAGSTQNFDLSGLGTTGLC